MKFMKFVQHSEIEFALPITGDVDVNEAFTDVEIEELRQSALDDMRKQVGGMAKVIDVRLVDFKIVEV
jgi:hypothetical protein